MKRLAIVLAALIIALAFVPQNADAGVGIKAGYTLSKFLVKPSGPVASNLPYFAGGLYFSIGLGFATIQPEILYIRTGWRLAEDPNFIMENWLDYIQVPLLLRLNIVPAGPVRPFLCGGGYGAYLLKATGVSIVTGEEPSKLDMLDTYERLDYGVLGGAGLIFKLPGLAITVEGRYNYGLKNLYLDPGDGEFQRNTSIMALVGIGF
jgi:Outer membrane protein beta-barrel domain